jgi:seryl-tRNA synthetase
MLISISWGRTQQWFDKLHPAKQKEYLAAHPHSKFGKDAAKSPTSKKGKAAAPVNKEHEKIRARIAALRKALASEQTHIEHLRAKPKRNVEEIARVGKNIVNLRQKIRELRDTLKKAGVSTVAVKPKLTVDSVKPRKKVESPVKVKPSARTTRPVKSIKKPKPGAEHPKPAHHVTKYLGADERESVHEALQDAGVNPKMATADHVEAVAGKQLKHWERKNEKAVTPSDRLHAKTLHKHWGRIVEKIKQVLKR